MPGSRVPVSAGVTVLLYLDMRMRKEGLDLALQAAAGGQQMTGDEFETVWRPPAAGQQPAVTEGKADDEPGRPAVELEDGVVAERGSHHDPGGQEGGGGEQAQPACVPEPGHADHHRQEGGGEGGLDADRDPKRPLRIRQQLPIPT